MEAQARSPLQWIKGPGIATAAVEVTAVAKIQSLVQELPYAMVPSLKKENIFNICIFMMICLGVGLFGFCTVETLQNTVYPAIMETHKNHYI